MLPKRKKRSFDQIFQDHSGITLKCAKELNTLFSDFDQAPQHIEKINSLEKEADRLVGETFQLLDNTFISRYDKPDIERFISHLDEVIDYMKKSTFILQVYRVQQPREEAIDFAAIILDMVNSFHDAIGKISTLKAGTMETYVIHIKELEEKADNLLHKSIQNLFDDEIDAKQIVMWKDIFEKLETVTDHAEDVINILSSIIRKESR